VKQTFVLLAVAAGNSGVSQRVVEPMLPRLADEFAVSVGSAASVIIGFTVAQSVAQYFHGPLGDRYGALKTITWMLALAAIASIGCAFSTDLTAMMWWRFASGFFSSGTMTLGMAFVADAVRAEERQPAIARFISGTIAGQALGPFVGGAMTDVFGWRATFILISLVFAAASAVMFATTRAQWRQWQPKAKARGALFSPTPYVQILKTPRARRVLFFVLLEMTFFYGAFSFLGVLLKERFDLSFTLIGTLLAGFGLGGILYSLSVRWLLARLGQRGCVTVGGALGGLCYLGAVLSPAWQPIMLLTIGIGLGFYMLHNTLQTKGTEMAPHARGSGMALFSMCWAGGQAVGAALMGALSSVLGVAPTIVAFGLGFALLGVAVRMRLQRL
jgi:predicted MFS family arabinose efflux permease